MLLHNHEQFKELLEITAGEQSIDDPALVEKDYWIMHCLYGLCQSGLNLELKGGTSLSKGFGVIHRFSEDIDIKIIPDQDLVGFEVKTGKNQNKPKQIESRKKYFEWLCSFLSGKIDGIIEIKRDEGFDDETGKYRNGGIRLIYNSIFTLPEGLKEGILLEVGFDKTTPNEQIDITSWAFERGSESLGREAIDDNRALGISCYESKFTFVEKLQAIVRKYRIYQEKGSRDNLPENFLRHYYDLYCLLDLMEVQSFIGTKEYEDYKIERFRSDDTVVNNCEGFHLSDPDEKELFKKNYVDSAPLYYKGQVPFDEILKKFEEWLPKL